MLVFVIDEPLSTKVFLLEYKVEHLGLEPDDEGKQLVSTFTQIAGHTQLFPSTHSTNTHHSDRDTTRFFFLLARLVSHPPPLSMTVTNNTAPNPLTLEWFKNNCAILEKGITPGLSHFPPRIFPSIFLVLNDFLFPLFLSSLFRLFRFC